MQNISIIQCFNSEKQKNCVDTAKYIFYNFCLKYLFVILSITKIYLRIYFPFAISYFHYIISYLFITLYLSSLPLLTLYILLELELTQTYRERQMSASRVYFDTNEPLVWSMNERVWTCVLLFTFIFRQ